MHHGRRDVALHTLDLVGPVGIEPTTNGLKVRCSTGLSYRPSDPLKIPAARIAGEIVSRFGGQEYPGTGFNPVGGSGYKIVGE